tara:strand:- start:2613 stop:3338 length:726 start_codon:yes stop_codon:yes gene_type:complete
MKYFKFGERTIIFYLENKNGSNLKVGWLSQLCISIQSEFQNIICEAVFSLHEITVFFREKPTFKDLKQIGLWINDFSLKKQKIVRTLWKIPVCFDPVFSSDLLKYFKNNNDAYKSYIKNFLDCEFQVHHYGFLPGFFYSVGLPTKLYLPRKKTPEKSVQPGTLAVGQSYVGIYPQTSPGGWYRIGKTYFSNFNIKKKSSCLLLPGDKINFISITHQEYKLESRNYEKLNKNLKVSSFEIIN